MNVMLPLRFSLTTYARCVSSRRLTVDAILDHHPSIELVLLAGDLSYADCEEVRLPTIRVFGQ